MLLSFQLSLLAWLHKGDDAKDIYEKMTGARVALEVYNRLSKKRDIEAFEVC